MINRKRRHDMMRGLRPPSSHRPGINRPPPGVELERDENPNESREDLAFPGDVAAVMRVLVSEGDEVVKGQRLISSRSEGGEFLDLSAPRDCTVERIAVREGQNVRRGEVAVRVKWCLHPVIALGMCAVCGKSIAEDELTSAPSSTTTTPSHHNAPSSSATSSSHFFPNDIATINVEGGHKIRVAMKEAKSTLEQATRRLLESRKLSLVLDLDHTLLHCSDDSKALKFAERKGEMVHTFKLSPHEPQLTLKLRPGLDEFLAQCSRRYQMYVYTAATRAYAECVCSIIDPTEAYFGNRIVTRTDTPELGTDKSLKRLFPADDTMVLIVDDRDVWGGVLNLITVQEYHFFGKEMHEVNNSSWTPTSESEEENEDATGTRGLLEEEEEEVVVLDESEKEAIRQRETVTPTEKLSPGGSGNTVNSILNSSSGTQNPKPPQTTSFRSVSDGGIRGITSSTSPIDTVERESNHFGASQGGAMDVGLMRVAALLTRVHEEFYANYDAASEAAARLASTAEGGTKPSPSLVSLPTTLNPEKCDVKAILARLRRRVLGKSVVICIDPTVRNAEWLGRRAVACGAKLQPTFDLRVTHYVSHYNTEMAKYAFDQGIRVVQPRWLEKSDHYWERLDEREYLLFRSSSTTSVAPISHPPLPPGLPSSSVASGASSSRVVYPYAATDSEREDDDEDEEESKYKRHASLHQAIDGDSNGEDDEERREEYDEGLERYGRVSDEEEGEEEEEGWGEGEME